MPHEEVCDDPLVFMPFKHHICSLLNNTIYPWMINQNIDNQKLINEKE
jgi:hypothetical protein